MKIKQISVFLENKPGQLGIPCRALEKAGVNIFTLSLADTHQFGVLRLIIEDVEAATKALEDAGCVVNVTEVIALIVPDRPGGLMEILDVIEKAGINLEYMYAFALRRKNEAVLIFRFEDPDQAVEVMKQSSISMVDKFELFER